jgi:Tol biopolymer transport system component
MRVGLGIVGVCLLLVAGLRPLATGRSAVHASGTGGGIGEAYLPAVLKPFIEGPTRRVSVATDGTQGNGTSNSPSISADGRYIVFDSVASNLISGDTNGHKDVFVYDQQTETLSRVSVASDGTEGNSYAAYPSISADGRYVTFVSDSSNLVIGDTNGSADIFVHDRQTGQTSRVSVASDGTQANSFSRFSSISTDGRYVVFDSEANNLVSDDTNGYWDIFVHDRQTGQTSRVSIASDGTEGNERSWYQSYISADGRYVVFSSDATNLVNGDTNNEMDVFVHDRQTGQTSRVSVASDGTQANLLASADSISSDGRYVVFSTMANNLVSDDTNGDFDVFVHDQQTGQTSRVSIAFDGTDANGDSSDAFISADGRYVVFSSEAGNLVGNDTNDDGDVFVHDRQTAQTSRVSVAFDGTDANGDSGAASISTDGRYVTFVSWATNLVGGDTNLVQDIFVHDRGE